MHRFYSALIEQKALGKVVEHASSLQIKLDAYELLRHILFHAGQYNCTVMICTCKIARLCCT
jgi:hypothetical protein